ncbi:aspartyl-phosphate phosphatase Spo0E family protein [Alteribacter natronophilus]|uniref:aspartyl-phosphate phosphatase Spo0E family protein n=1 Tax=Alteribacter natronophilus TaxID=2583810 RepID=UPI00110DCC13|nr:aspartyl-phosphate phosphatase Spo0E family protein [Alteribacter natronophilus]TMW72502.1 aspartyl-phosphate phosphatase Spo0E family protein [Alteribacter natronophilus]
MSAEREELKDERLSSLLVEIEKLRKEMLKAAELNGRDHPSVLEYSKEIDRYHNLLIQYRQKRDGA